MKIISDTHTEADTEAYTAQKQTQTETDTETYTCKKNHTTTTIITPPSSEFHPNFSAYQKGHHE
jgi:hypothetical protein